MTGGNGFTTTTKQSVAERLQTIKQRVEKGREDKARAEATLEQLEAQRAEVLARLEVLGVSADDLSAEIARLDQEIQAKLAEAEAALNPVVPA